MKDMHVKGLLASANNLIGVIRHKQWERLDSKADCLELAVNHARALAAPDEAIAAAARDVLAERQRQTAKGWTPEHDDTHRHGEIIMEGWGARSRLLRANGYRSFGELSECRDQLVKAGALILAEIERLDRIQTHARAAAPAAGGDHG